MSGLRAMQEAAKSASGNPSSLHWAGRAARRVLDDARDRLAAYIHTEAGSIVFTSGGTEANNLAIYGWLAGQQPGRIVVSAIEHPSVLRPMEQWGERPGWELVCVRPNVDGFVEASEICLHINEDTRLVCMMMANNETGVIQPVKQVADYCHEHGIAMLVDAVQALGKLPLNVAELGADFVSLSSHKIGGPKGVGALVVRRGCKLLELTPGGGQERGRRSGTENVPGITGFAAVLGELDYAACASVRTSFEQQLIKAIPQARILGCDAQRLVNTSMFCLPGIDGETLLMQLDLAGFAVASGSACSSGKRDPSHVLLAMGVPQEQARSSIRASFGPSNTEDDAQALVNELVRIHSRLKAMAGMAA
ncbi:MAG: cysteine desulfurase family protein [Mariprofundaceae bacterium]